MNYKDLFLNTLDIRFGTNAIGYYLSNFAKCSSCKDFFYGDDKTCYASIIAILLFVDYAQYDGDECDVNSIKEFLEYLKSEYGFTYNTDALFQKIFTECFFNTNYQVYEFKHSLSPNLIRFSILTEENSYNKVVFKLSRECRKWLYSSYEVESLGKIEIDSLILKKEIEAGNFEKAKNAAFELSKTLQDEIDYLLKLKKNIVKSADFSDFKDIYNTFQSKVNLLKEKKKDIANLNNYVREIFEIDLDNIDVSEKEFTGSKLDVARTQDYLKKIEEYQLQLIDTILDVKRTYDNSTMDLSFISSSKYVNVEKEILNPIKNNKNVSYALFNVICPLLGIDNKKIASIFNINTLLMKQKLENEEITEKRHIIDYDNEEIVDEVKNFDVANLKEMINIIIKDLIKNDGELNLKTCINNHEEFIGNITLLKTIIMLLSLDINRDISFITKKNLKDEDKFSVKNIIQFYYDEYKYIIGEKHLKIYLLEEAIYIEGPKINGMQETLKVDHNLLLKLEDA